MINKIFENISFDELVFVTENSLTTMLQKRIHKNFSNIFINYDENILAKIFRLIYNQKKSNNNYSNSNVYLNKNVLYSDRRRDLLTYRSKDRTDTLVHKKLVKEYALKHNIDLEYNFNYKIPFREILRIMFYVEDKSIMTDIEQSIEIMLINIYEGSNFRISPKVVFLSSISSILIKHLMKINPNLRNL